MALIKCPECQTEISDQAPTCPRRGLPLKKEMSTTINIDKIVEKKIQTIQLTSKRWKAIKVAAVILFIIGLIVVSQGHAHNNGQNATTGIGIFLIFISIIAFFVAKFGAWWHNR